MPNKSQEMNFEDWGQTPYQAALERQLAYVHERIEGKAEDRLIFTEHDAVFTLGSRAGAEKNVLLDKATLEEKQIGLIETNRGGDVTYHGPGQLVGYPIISLDKQRDLHAYLRNLEQVIINALGALGLSTHRNPGKTGIWVKDQKIAAIGVAARKWVTYHGFSINVNTDLTPFSYIVPCGIAPEEGGVTSLQETLGLEFDMEMVKKVIAVEFWALFGSLRSQEEST